MRVTNQRSWRQIALTLIGATMAYNMIEAGVALWSGWMAESVALIGFGLDSMIEFAAATVVLQHLAAETRGDDPEELDQSEHRAHRFVGGTFMLLATYVTLQSAWILWRQEAPEESLIGIVLAGVSLVIMPLISWG